MPRVLIAVDGSELGRQAAGRAIELLGPDHDVTIVRVVSPVVPIIAVPAATIAPAVPLHDDAIEESNRALMQDAEADVVATARVLDVGATTRVLVGDPGPELCRLAETEDFDLLVVGSHGSGLLKRVLLGSVSHHVLHHAPCPVLVVRSV